MILESGTGNGSSASVSSDNRLNVSARTSSRATYVSRDTGQTYCWSAAKNIDATDTILLVCNKSSTKLLYIEKIIIGSDTALTRFTVHSPVFPTLAGTLITGTNDNRLSGNLADALAYEDETGNTQANVLHQGILVAGGMADLIIDGRIILGFNQSIAVDFVTEVTMATCTIVGWYE
jgi:hypothetical protein